MVVLHQIYHYDQLASCSCPTNGPSLLKCRQTPIFVKIGRVLHNFCMGYTKFVCDNIKIVLLLAVFYQMQKDRQRYLGSIIFFRSNLSLNFFSYWISTYVSMEVSIPYIPEALPISQSTLFWNRCHWHNPKVVFYVSRLV